MWLRALSPMEGLPVEDVLVGLDEYSNVLWAVERRVDGHEACRPAATRRTGPRRPVRGTLASPPTGAAVRDAAPHGIRTRWTTGRTAVRRFVQRRLADLSGTTRRCTPAAAAEVLRVRTAGGEAVHEIEPATVPSIGVVLERRYRLARDVRWQPGPMASSARRSPFLRPPSRALRFDVLAEDTCW